MTQQAMRSGFLQRRLSIIPGFGLTMGITVFALSIIVLVPLSAVFITSAGMGWHDFAKAAFSRRALAASNTSW